MKSDSKILAHGGFSSKYPENTRIAFRKALELPIDGLEFDVHITADEVPVVIHDSYADRTTDGTGPIVSMTLQELRRLNAATNHLDVGFQAVPTLQEVLDDAYRICPQGLYNIELKVNDGGGFETVVERVVSVAKGHPLKERLLISSFHHQSLAYLKENHPTYRLGLLMDEFVPDVWYLANQYGAYSVHLNHHHVTDDIVEGCRNHGVRTAIWTVDDAAHLKRFMQMNTDIVITNVPDVAHHVKKLVRKD